MNLNPKSVNDPHSIKSNDLNREMFAMWGFVIFTFAGLIFALCVIWAKCNGN